MKEKTLQNIRDNILNLLEKNSLLCTVRGENYKSNSYIQFYSQFFPFFLSSYFLLQIEDSDRFKIALKGYGYFKDEKKALISEGKTAIRYRREIAERSHPRQGFQFTYTAVKNRKYFLLDHCIAPSCWIVHHIFYTPRGD